MTATIPTFSNTPTHTTAQLGECAHCGWTGDLRANGKLVTHKERRVRRDKSTRTNAHLIIKPAIYESLDDCDGSGRTPTRDDK